jgi:uncharacterized protein (DUF1778 family)
MNDNQPLPATDDVVYLDPDEWDRFMEEMLNPKPPTQKMRDAWEMHRRLAKPSMPRY